MAPKFPHKLPLPPTDLSKRRLPMASVGGPVYRIHRHSLGCLHFGKDFSGRFNDPLGQFGVLYATLRPEGAFVEVFLRRLSLMILRELELQERSISVIGFKKLQCVDLTGSGLRRVSCDNRITTEMAYHTIGLWSRAFSDHPQQPDGVIYRSRHNPQFKCLALFDRCQRKLTLSVSEPLLSGSRRMWTIAQIAKYKLAIEPMT